MADKVLKFGIPKGSLEEQTLELMRKSGWRITVGSRSYIPTTDDPTSELPHPTPAGDAAVYRRRLA